MKFQFHECFDWNSLLKVLHAEDFRYTVRVLTQSFYLINSVLETRVMERTQSVLVQSLRLFRQLYRNHPIANE